MARRKNELTSTEMNLYVAHPERKLLNQYSQKTRLKMMVRVNGVQLELHTVVLYAAADMTATLMGQNLLTAGLTNLFQGQIKSLTPGPATTDRVLPELLLARACTK